jgi:hypothetical protein
MMEFLSYMYCLLANFYDGIVAYLEKNQQGGANRMYHALERWFLSNKILINSVIWERPQKKEDATKSVGK